jgi:drug/metabolite transporter (DMT)-like permease
MAEIGISAAPGSRRGLGVLVLVLSCMALAGNNVLVPLVYAHGITPPALLLVRYLFVTAVLLITVPFFGNRVWIERPYWGHALGAGACVSLGALCLITAFGLIPVGLVLLIVYLYPVLTAIGQSSIEGKAVGRSQALCLLGAFAGLAIALGAGSGRFVQDANLAGLSWSFGAALGFTGFFVWSRYGLSGAEPGATVLATSMVGSLIAAVSSITLHVSGMMDVAVPSLSDGLGWLGILCVSVCFLLAYFGMSWGVQLSGAATATMLMNLEIVFTLPLAAAVLGEALDARRLLGAALVLTAVAASQWSRRSEL